MRPQPPRLRGVVIVAGALALGGSVAPRLGAQAPPPAQAQAPPAKPTVATKSVSLPPAEAKRRMEEIRQASEREFENPPDHTLARRELRGFDVVIDGQTVRVTQTVRILDRRPGMRYFWKLVVTDPARPDRVVRERSTSDRPFTVPETRLRTAHTASLELPPGTYRVEMRLYEWPPGVPLARFADPAVARGFRSVAVHKVVTVPPAP